MDDAAVEIEQAIADAATVLLRLDKYRRGREADVAALGRRVADVGARARRAHRSGHGLDTLEALRDETLDLLASLRVVVAEVLESDAYRRAVAAFGRGDHAALQPLLFEIFAGLGPGQIEGELFVPLEWSGRRGPRPPDEMLAAIETLRAEGLAASGDVLEPGVDPDLPAVALSGAWPDGAPVALACRVDDLPGPAVRGPTGEVLLHRPVLQLPFDVVFQLDREAVDEWVDDPLHYRRVLAPLLEARGYRTRRVRTPAAP